MKETLIKIIDTAKVKNSILWEIVMKENFRIIWGKEKDSINFRMEEFTKESGLKENLMYEEIIIMQTVAYIQGNGNKDSIVVKAKKLIVLAAIKVVNT